MARTRGNSTVNQTTPAKLAKRPHRKSRKGCLNCKRRKCDEAKPTCASCIRFGIPCVPSEAQPLSANQTTLARDPSRSNRAVTAPRGRGRPRKDWTIPLETLGSTVINSPADSSKVQEPNLAPCSLNIADIELLLHFNSCTAQTLADTDDNNDPVRNFWENNLARIGLTHHFVLHLAFAVAGYHLAHLETEINQQQLYTSLAKHHVSEGLTEFTKILPHLNDANCGAIYVSAMLVCYCNFAAGPTSENDLLVCHLDNEDPVTWLPLVHGVRSIHATVDPTVLFSGLMSPFGPADRPVTLSSPTYKRTNLSRLDWEEPLGQLRRYLTTSNGPSIKVCLKSLDEVAMIYEATYGKRDGSCDVAPENQFVFGWLYRLTDDFVACLHHKEPPALLVLAYYSLLFRSVGNAWYVHGWTGHILLRLREFIGQDVAPWLQWPMEQAGLTWTMPNVYPE